MTEPRAGPQPMLNRKHTGKLHGPGQAALGHTGVCRWR
jgi:hypothetical protein